MMTYTANPKAAAQFQRALRRAAGTSVYQPIGGLGDEAFWMGEGLSVRKGTAMLMVALPVPPSTPSTPGGAPSPALAAAYQIAATALPRL